ncbi:MAG: IgGFc-binding protein [Myxococcales bacterium]|nr:IgGFc-binding protein [Myxococcales bacterium]
MTTSALARGACLVALLPIVACSCDPDRLGSERPDAGTVAGGDGDGDGPPAHCTHGNTLCDGDMARICDGRGGIETVACGEQGKVCVNSATSPTTGEFLPLGCVDCVPGTSRCEGGMGEYCAEDGSGFIRFECDAMQGMECTEQGCTGRCAPPEAKHSYIGCDYYPTVTLNPVWRGFDFAVSVANAGDSNASVIVTRGDEAVATANVAVGGIEVIVLPWNLALKGGDVDACQVTPDPGASRLEAEGAYRLRSDQPVTVHQFNPLSYQLADDDGDAPAGCPLGVECSPEYGTSDCLSYSNDASLLLPATSLTGDYTVMSWPSAGNTASFYAITATEDGTEVTVSGSAAIEAGGGLSQQGNGTVAMQRGDVLQVVAQRTAAGDDATISDVSGTHIHANKPIQVVGGNSCAFVPDVSAGECDHIEQALFPSQILGDEYVVSYPAAVASVSPHILRVSAIFDDTEIALDPPIVPAFSMSRSDPPRTIRIGAYEMGEQREPMDVHVAATRPIVVAQYMQGLESVPSGSGDPSMALAVPVAQYRTNYVFTAPETYDTNFINVVGPPDAQLVLDGEPVRSQGTAAGSSGFAVFRIELPHSTAGSHTLEANAPVGLLVYGYGRFTSYMYPGGLDLQPITQIGPQ